ncbi:hypothetical protein D9M72_538610 [compost metagenome]
MHEMQRQVGRHAVLLAFIPHGRKHGFAIDGLGLIRQLHRLHERRVATDRIGGEQVEVERLGARGKVCLQLVPEAVTVEEQEFDLVLVGNVGLGVVGVGGGAQRHLLRAARPAEHGDLGQRRACQQAGDTGCEQRSSFHGRKCHLWFSLKVVVDALQDLRCRPRRRSPRVRRRGSMA